MSSSCLAYGQEVPGRLIVILSALLQVTGGVRTHVGALKFFDERNS